MALSRIVLCLLIIATTCLVSRDAFSAPNQASPSKDTNLMPISTSLDVQRQCFMSSCSFAGLGTAFLGAGGATFSVPAIFGTILTLTRKDPPTSKAAHFVWGTISIVLGAGLGVALAIVMPAELSTGCNYSARDTTIAFGTVGLIVNALTLALGITAVVKGTQRAKTQTATRQSTEKNRKPSPRRVTFATF